MEVETILEPKCFLHFLQQTEIKEGRVRTVHWGPRTLDLDILFFDDLIYSDEELTVPHPDMKNRDFVLVPLAQIAGYKRHPVFRLTVDEMVSQLKEYYISKGTLSYVNDFNDRYICVGILPLYLPSPKEAGKRNRRYA